MKVEARPWNPSDLIDDLQKMIDEEPDRYLNDRRTTLCMARDYLKKYFDETEALIKAPCRVGDTIYHITTGTSRVMVHDGTVYGYDGGPGTATGLYCPYELSESCPFDAEDFDCDKNKDKYAVFKDTVSALILDECGEQMIFEYSGSEQFQDFGRLVFLDEEAAKDALRKMLEEGRAT